MDNEEAIKNLRKEIAKLEYLIMNFYAICFISEPDHAKRHHAELKSLKSQLLKKKEQLVNLIN